MKKLLLATMLFCSLSMHAGSMSKAARGVWHLLKIVGGINLIYLYRVQDVYNQDSIKTFIGAIKCYCNGTRRTTKNLREIASATTILALPSMVVLDGVHGLWNVCTEKDDEVLSIDSDDEA